MFRTLASIAVISGLFSFSSLAEATRRPNGAVERVAAARRAAANRAGLVRRAIKKVGDEVAYQLEVKQDLVAATKAFSRATRAIERSGLVANARERAVLLHVQQRLEAARGAAALESLRGGERAMGMLMRLQLGAVGPGGVIAPPAAEMAAPATTLGRVPGTEAAGPVAGKVQADETPYWGKNTYL